MLDRLGVNYRVNPGLVRGLDYYCRTVFEWITDDLGAQGTVCAGGRYDDLVAMQGGKPTPGIGFALGVERLLALLEANGVEHHQVPHVFLVSQVDAADMLALAERLRSQVDGLRLAVALAGGSFKAQFKRADRSGARFALVLGSESELAPDGSAQGFARCRADQESAVRSSNFRAD
jgi:histidyl-tRNA synthetase